MPRGVIIIKQNMTWRSPMPIKFSNLLQTNPDSTVYGLDLSTFSNMENSKFLVERLRRKSLNIGTLKSQQPVDSFNPEAQNKNISHLINKSKINRLLLQANFQKQSNLANSRKKKKMYVIRRKDEKIKLDEKDKKQNSQRKYRYKEQEAVQEQRSIQSPDSKKCQQMFKIKRRVPKFGIQDIAPRLASKKSNEHCLRTAGLFMSTSSNSFYNSTFYMSSKLKEVSDFRCEKSKDDKKQLSPQVTNLVPHPLINQNLIYKKKQREKMYTTNFGFSFTRSKTEEIEPNLVCGWERLEQEQNEFLD